MIGQLASFSTPCMPICLLKLQAPWWTVPWNCKSKKTLLSSTSFCLGYVILQAAEKLREDQNVKNRDISTLELTSYKSPKKLGKLLLWKPEASVWEMVTADDHACIFSEACGEGKEGPWVSSLGAVLVWMLQGKKCRPGIYVWFYFCCKLDHLLLVPTSRLVLHGGKKWTILFLPTLILYSSGFWTLVLISHWSCFCANVFPPTEVWALWLILHIILHQTFLGKAVCIFVFHSKARLTLDARDREFQSLFLKHPFKPWSAVLQRKPSRIFLSHCSPGQTLWTLWWGFFLWSR